ncbi:MAG: sigma-70 family RNA polymerase sigma factor [Bacteroidales bacterium]|jgi:RNA polymerase sigma-70 factor (ECF subfamily)|nr:sigma-70 family RNA polymerase sigma factor [Bacteroidales bacterium]
MGLATHLTDKGIRDYELVKRALERGDQKAYANLMENYREPIYYMLLRMTNSNTDADDLTLEAFGKAFKSLDQYTPDFAFSTWLFTIATNNCIDFIRKRRVETLSIDKDYVNAEGEVRTIEITSETLDPEEIIIEKQMIEMMHEIIKKLKPLYQHLIELRYFKELSYEEICEQTGLPLHIVKIKLFRAKSMLYNTIMKHRNHPLRDGFC